MTHALDMVGSLKKNRDLSASRRDRIAAIRQQYIGFEKVRAAQGVQTKISPEELALVKMQIRKTLRVQRTRAVVIACVASVIFAVLLVVAFVYIAQL